MSERVEGNSSVAGAEALARPEGTLGLPPQHSAGLALAIKRGFENIEVTTAEVPCHWCQGIGVCGAGDEAGGCDDCGGTGIQYECDFDEDAAWKAAAESARAFLSSEAQSPQSAEGVPSALAQDEPLPSSPLPDLLREVVEALKPFAVAYEDAGDPYDEDGWAAWEHPLAMNVTVGNFRRAFAALSHAQEIMGDDR
jgi:hypothetical protein